MLNFHVIGNFPPGRVEIVSADSSYTSSPESEALIAAAWAEAKARLGDKLFDGEMCRLEHFDARDDKLTLHLSRTSYRVFVGTNMTKPDLPAQQRANPIGVSTALISADNFFMLGRRSGNVAYYPHKLHPFAGSIDPAEKLDLFAEARRELAEELSLAAGEIASIACVGLVEDAKLRHPEAILIATTTIDRAEIESRLDRHEHAACWACPATPDALSRAIAHDRAEFTPVAMSSMLLFGKANYGEQWWKETTSSLRLYVSSSLTSSQTSS